MILCAIIAVFGCAFFHVASFSVVVIAVRQFYYCAILAVLQSRQTSIKPEFFGVVSLSRCPLHGASHMFGHFFKILALFANNGNTAPAGGGDNTLKATRVNIDCTV